MGYSPLMSTCLEFVSFFEVTVFFPRALSHLLSRMPERKKCAEEVCVCVCVCVFILAL